MPEITTPVAGGAVAVAVNVTGEPFAPLRAAARVCCPSADPRVQITSATPSPSVTVTSADTEPSPEGAQEMLAPGRAAPVARRARIATGWVSLLPTTPSWPSPRKLVRAGASS
jgi:hypothetical protein